MTAKSRFRKAIERGRERRKQLVEAITPAKCCYWCAHSGDVPVTRGAICYCSRLQVDTEDTNVCPVWEG